VNDLNNKLTINSSLNKINIDIKSNKNIPKIDLSKLNENEENVQSETSSKLDKMIDEALENELETNPDFQSQFDNHEEMKR